MPAQKDRRRRSFFYFEFARALNKPLLCCGVIPLLSRHPLGVPTERIGPGNAIQQVRFTAPCQSAKSAFSNLIPFLIKLTSLQILSHKGDNLATHVITIILVHV